MKKFIKIITISVPIVFFSLSCGNSAEDVFGEINREKSKEVRQLIEDELNVGSSSKEIEEFFNKHEITNSYDEFSGRYQAIIRDVAPKSKANQVVIIYIYVDEKKEFVKSEVEDSFTGL